MTGIEYNTLYGDSPEQAYQMLFNEYFSYVYSIVYNRLRSCSGKEDIEECVSDIFAEIYFNYDRKCEYRGDLRGYIGTVAKRKAINKFHSITSRSSHMADIDEQAYSNIASGTDMEEDADNIEMRHILLNEIENLGEPDSTIIIQKFYYNRTSKEIASFLSMKASAVRMRSKRAMDKLKQRLENTGITL